MDKKRKMILAAVAITVLAVAAIIVFLIKTSGMSNTSVSIDLNGTWKVLLHRDEQVNDEYFVFDHGKAECYQGEGEEPALKDEYTLSNDGELKLASLGLETQIRPVNENYIIMVEDGKPMWRLMRVADGTRTPAKLADEALQGKWSVKIHGSTLAVKEYLTFENGQLTALRNENESYLSGEYILHDTGILEIPAVNQQMELYPLNDDVIMLMQIGDGYIWQIERIKQ